MSSFDSNGNYNKTNWKDNDLITADKLNKIEDALETINDKIEESSDSGEDVDLSGYATKDELNNKIDKVEGKSLISDTEISRLSNVFNYDDTEIKEDVEGLKTSKHNHDNKEILDVITQTKINEWNNKSTFNGDYNDLTNKPTIPTVTNDLTNTLKSNYDVAYNHSQVAHSPSNAQKNSDITKSEIEEKLIGNITSHTHNQYLTEHQDISGKADKTELHNHSNKIVLDGITSDKVTEWNNKSTFNGDYNNLSNKPTIPSIEGLATEEFVKDEIDTKVSQAKTDIIDQLNYITPQMFGAKADGVTDDSEAILQAIAALPKDGGILYFPAGTYIHGDGTTTGLSYQIDTSYPEGHAYYPAPLMQNKGVDDKIGRSIKFDFEGYTNLTIKGDGAIIQSHENNGECSNNRFFQFKRCENVIMEGITIDGKRHERGIKLSDYSPGGYDLQRSNLYFNKCKRVILRNVISKGAQMDGMAIGAGTQTDYSEDFLIEKCKFLDNHRQGISIEGVTNVTIRDVECSLNGTGQGIMPKSGIDIEAYGDVNEYEHYSFNRNILIDKCYFDNNGYSNIVVNKNSFGTTIQNCTFKNAWVVAEVNNEAKLLNCRLENSNLTNGFSRVAYNTVVFNKGGYFMFSNDTSPNSETIIEHNTFDFTPTVDTFKSLNYNTMRLIGLETFRNNYVKNGVAAVNSGHYSLCFSCKELVGNTFELTDTVFNGVQVLTNADIKGGSAEGSKLKDNRYIGEYTGGIASINEYYKTDYTICKSYNSYSLSTSKLCKLFDYGGLIKITVRYLEQEEVILLSKTASYCHHHILRRNINLAGKNVVTIYRDNSKNYYLKYTWTNVSTTIECAYTYGETEITGLESMDWLTVSDVSASGLTVITAVDTSVFTSALKTNYDKAYTHSNVAHAPSNAQKNSDITKAEIEAKLTGVISSHSHDGMGGDYVNKNWGSENAGMILMIGSDGNVALYDLADYNPNAQWYTVTQNYTNVTSDFKATQVKESLPLTIHLSSTNGKKLDDVKVIMNGQDVTTNVYSDGTIIISSVTGTVVITADAMLYTNLADPTNPEWVNGSRLDNTGNVISVPYGIITNVIPAKAGDTIRIKGLAQYGSGDILSHVVMDIRKKDGSKYYVQCLETIKDNGFFSSMTEDKTNGMVTVVFNTGLDVGFIRVSGEIIDPELRTDTVIVTVNEEIID